MLNHSFGKHVSTVSHLSGLDDVYALKSLPFHDSQVERGRGPRHLLIGHIHVICRKATCR